MGETIFLKVTASFKDTHPTSYKMKSARKLFLVFMCEEYHWKFYCQNLTVYQNSARELPAGRDVKPKAESGH